MHKTPLLIITLSIIFYPLLEASDDQDPALSSLNQKIEQINKKLEENWVETTKEEVHGQNDFIGEWQEYQRDLNDIKDLNENRQKLQDELKKLNQEKANYIKNRTQSQ